MAEQVNIRNFFTPNISNMGGTASAIRRNTSVLGGKPRRPSSIMKNAPPHKSESSMMTPQSALDMRGLVTRLSRASKASAGLCQYCGHYR